MDSSYCSHPGQGWGSNGGIQMSYIDIFKSYPRFFSSRCSFLFAPCFLIPVYLVSIRTDILRITGSVNFCDPAQMIFAPFT